jgi:hypothetical protein
MDRCWGGAPTGTVMQREGGRIVLTPPATWPRMPRSARSSSTSRKDRPKRRYQRTASTITSGGKQKPAKADRGTVAGRGRQGLMTTVGLLWARAQQVQQCRTVMGHNPRDRVVRLLHQASNAGSGPLPAATGGQVQRRTPPGHSQESRPLPPFAVRIITEPLGSLTVISQVATSSQSGDDRDRAPVRWCRRHSGPACRRRPEVAGRGGIGR